VAGVGAHLYIHQVITAHGGRLWAESPGSESAPVSLFTFALQPKRVAGTSQSINGQMSN